MKTSLQGLVTLTNLQLHPWKFRARRDISKRNASFKTPLFIEFSVINCVPNVN